MSELIFNLERIRIDLGTHEGPLSDLMKFARFNGLNDNYEPLEKPRLVGTWTVNNYTSLYLLDLSRSLFDGLTINCSNEWIIDFNDLAVQTLDSTQPNYNPAAAIILHNNNKGILLDGPVAYNQNGRWFLTKTQASLISSIGKWFLSTTTVIDNDKICGLSADSYNFTGFNEFEYFTGTGSSLTEGTFSGCTLLLTIKLPSNITTLNTNSYHATSGTFSNCTSLDVPVTVFNNITYIDNAYEHVASGNSFINSGCFNNCLSLKWQTLPPNLTYIGYCAFNNCNNLLLNCTLNFVTQVRMKAFSGCSKIIYIELPSVTYLSYLAFAGCTLLTEIQLPESLNLIRESAFLNCSNLNIDHLPNNLVTLELNAFLNCSSLTLSTLPLTLQTIGNRAFEGCALSVSSLPSSLINIYDWAFGNQTNMHLGDHISCNIIGNHAFYGVNFPSNLTISTLELETIRVALGWPSPAISSDFITLNNVTKIGTTVLSQYNIFKSTSIVHITVDTPPNLIAPGFLNVAKIYIGNGLASHDESVINDYAVASNWSTLYNNGKLLPWYLHEHTPALQSYDSSAPNYYPALCICFEQAGYGRYITTNNKTKGWYMSDEEAASITDTGNILKDKLTVTDVNGICGTVGATYTLRSADLSSFTNIESIDLSGSIKMSNVTIAQNSPLSKYKLPTVEDCDWRNSGGWIYNNGTAYIDTGVVFSAANTKIDISLEIINNNDNNTQKGFIGTNNKDWNWSGFIGGMAEGKVFLGSGSAVYAIETYSLNQKYNIIYDKKSIYLEDILKGTCSGSDDNNNIIIFSRGTSHISNSFRFYYIKIWNNDTLIREMYPAVDFNGTYCMYDYVTELFFYNQGTGSFTVSDKVIAKGKGIPVNSSSNAYWRYSGGYIKSSGTQYINSNLIPQSGFSMELKFKLINTSQTTYFGARNGNLNKSLWVWFNTRANIQLGSTNYDGRSPQLSANTEYVLALKSDGFYLNGTRFVNDVALTFTLDYPLYLFGGNNGGNSTTDNSMAIYYCKLYQSNTLVREMYPAIDSNGVVCMYDYVSNLYFYNQGTGNFTASQEVIDGHITPYQLSLVGLPNLKIAHNWRKSGGYIQSDGNAYINTNQIIDNTCEIFIKFQRNTNYDGRIIGTVGTTSSPSTQFIINGYNNANQIQVIEPNIESNVNVPSNGILEVEMSINKQIVRSNDTIYLNKDIVRSTYEMSNPLFLFGTNYASNKRISNSKIYSFILKKNNVIVCELYPAIDENGVACMYDYVSEQFIYNANNSGLFTVSSEVWKYDYEGDFNIGIPSKINSLTFSNCPNIDSIKLLSKIASAQDTLLNTVNATIPNTTGSIEDLISIAALWNNQSGENSNLKISGNYIVNNTYVTTSQCEDIGYNPQGSHTLISSKIYGLNVTINDIVPDISTIALQTFDSTKECYNPAVSIKLENVGYGSYLDTNDKTKGWYLTKEAAATITTLPSFNAFNQASDVNGICGTVGAKYNFTSFNELELFIGLTVIDDNQFRQCANLVSIKIPSTIVSIGVAAFFSTSIQSIVIPSSTTSIGSYAFNMCTSLTTATIYSQLTKLNDYLFKQCTSLNDFYCYATTPPTFGLAALDNTPNLSHVYVPAESVDVYKVAYGWSSYASKIEAIPLN